jgi:hypothetical protein
LVITIALMVLLTTLAVGLLSLSSVALRKSGLEHDRAAARANARFALMLALGELQRELGDDCRTTADAEMLGNEAMPGLVGVWDRWQAPKMGAAPTRAGPGYATEKARFRRWLISHPIPATTAALEWGKTADFTDGIALFRPERDGFKLTAPVLATPGGGYAWGIAQENTKAKVNVAGTEVVNWDANDVLHAAPRPNLALSAVLKQPEDQWPARAAKVNSASQVGLDRTLAGSTQPVVGADFTTHALGLLTNPLAGGFKGDLSLGLEMSDADFAAIKWGEQTNPFRTGTLAAYKNQQPLYTPLVPQGGLEVTIQFGAVKDFVNKFNAGHTPTFDSLRSHYRMYQHLYQQQGQLTAFERPGSHVAWPRVAGRLDGKSTQLSLRPMLDRLLYFLSLGVDSGTGIPYIMWTPVVTLWNPHNVGLDSEGLVAYPWMDLPIFVGCTLNAGAANAYSFRDSLSRFLGDGRVTGGGRQGYPYFYVHCTDDGRGRTSKPIHFEPGEVKVFALAQAAPVPFDRMAAEATRTINLKAVMGVSDIVTSGGFVVALNKTMGAAFARKVTVGDKVSATIDYERGPFHYYIGLEDAGRILGKEPQKITEVQAHFGKSTNSAVSPVFSGAELMAKPKLMAVLETYHRVAVSSGQVADLAYTTNARQPYINRYLSASTDATNRNEAAGPHYESSLRPCADVIGAGLQLTPEGGGSYYGESNSAGSGRSKLVFYEVPRGPLLSLAGFQHADLANTAFGPSYQVGNSWASPYLPRSAVGKIVTKAATPNQEQIAPNGLPGYDHCYLLNEALWDDWYFSGATAATYPATGIPSAATAWTAPLAGISRTATEAAQDFVRDPIANPLRNPRLLLWPAGSSGEEMQAELAAPEACLKLAAHLLVDGAFNVNSTRVEAWIAQLASLRNAPFAPPDGGRPPADHTILSRFRDPAGTANDRWLGYRALTDAQIRKLAEEIVVEVRQRGPFQSLGEFVNRRIGSRSDPLALAGAIQAAIDRCDLSTDALYSDFDTSGYPNPENISPVRTGVATPGYLTQADVLTGLGPFLTTRSDAFVIRAYGEARNAAGTVTATAQCEAVVQRVPEFLDPRDAATTPPAAANPVNRLFGRRFVVVSWRTI